ncbi:MAG TPA: polyphosphate kinase 2 family protein [Ilumatobacteraceae bacterium]|nr:polyphosphate kinase 2 family protein [Ilumatobacteraceae bacterium]
MGSAKKRPALAEEFRAVTNNAQRVDLAAIDPGAHRSISKRRATDDVESGKLRDRLARLSDLIDANRDRSVLLVLQGLDGSGKSGVVRHVVGAMTPSIVRVRAFKEPTAAERRHHFLWRIEQELPDPGELVVFDRSHYEDLVVPVVEGQLNERELNERATTINRFERKLAKQQTEVIKLFLHLSFDAQRERFLRRLRRPDKRWKFSESDLDTRDHWSEIQAAFSQVMGLTNTDDAPWYVVPADERWYRNWIVANILCERLEALNMQYPQPVLDDHSIIARLNASANQEPAP